MTITKARAVRRRRGSIIEIPGARGVSYKLKFDLPTDVKGERKTHYKTIRGTRDDAETELARLTGQAGKGTDLDAGKQTLETWIETWLELDHDISTRTLERYAELLRGHVVPRLGRYPLATLGPLQIERCYAALAKSGLAPRSIVHVHRVLFQCLRDAKRYHGIDNPAENVKRRRIKQGQEAKMHVLPLETLLSLFETIRETNFKSLPYPLAILAFDSGARRGELLAIRWSDVDFDKRTLRIERAVDDTKAHGVVIKNEPKNESSRRTITLSLQTIETLKAWRARQGEDRLMLGKPLPDDALVFPLSIETPTVPLRPREVTKSFSRIIAKRPDCAGFRLHDLRHSCASHLLERGVSIPEVSRHLGHSSPQITMTVYAHAIPDTGTGIGLLDRLTAAAAE